MTLIEKKGKNQKTLEVFHALVLPLVYMTRPVETQLRPLKWYTSSQRALVRALIQMTMLLETRPRRQKSYPSSHGALVHMTRLLETRLECQNWHQSPSACFSPRLDYTDQVTDQGDRTDTEEHSWLGSCPGYLDQTTKNGTASHTCPSWRFGRSYQASKQTALDTQETLRHGYLTKVKTRMPKRHCAMVTSLRCPNIKFQ